MGKYGEKDVIATEIIPQLWRLSVVPTLNLQQVSYIKILFKKFLCTKVFPFFLVSKIHERDQKIVYES